MEDLTFRELPSSDQSEGRAPEAPRRWLAEGRFRAGRLVGVRGFFFFFAGAAAARRLAGRLTDRAQPESPGAKPSTPNPAT